MSLRLCHTYAVVSIKTAFYLPVHFFSRLVKKTEGLSYADIGRVEVGTETLVDKSKSVKSVLMKLFEGKVRHK